MNKTAMQELIDEIKLIESYPMNPLIIKIATDLLEKEKDQIVKAFEQGLIFGFPTNGSKYFNKTYNQNK